MKILTIFLTLLCISTSYAATYNVTDDSSFDAVPWPTLVAGDSVKIFWREEPYRKKIGLQAQGTEDSPVVIHGVKGPGGELPHLFGENATTPENLAGFFSYHDVNYPGFMGIIIINADWGTKPSHIIIENLKLSGANEHNDFYDETGLKRRFYGGAGGIYVYTIDNLTVRGCEISDNGNGFYTRSVNHESRVTRNILFEKNYVYGNGNIDGDQRHNIYTESAGIIFQYNRIGRERAGARGSSFKDRSAGLIFRYNWIESTARTMDMVEAEEGAPILIYEPDYDATYLYGNIVINEIDDDDEYVSAGTIFHYGADNFANDNTGECVGDVNGDPVCRTGTLFFYNNTVIIKDYRDTKESEEWVQDRLFELSINVVSADIRNNIFYVYSPNGHANLTLMTRYGTANLNGTNWINTDWVEGKFNFWDTCSYGGVINRNGTLLEGSDPGFVHLTGISGDLSGDNYTPAMTSSCLDKSHEQALKVIESGNNVSDIYTLHADGKKREITGKTLDLGALEATTTSILSQNPFFDENSHHLSVQMTRDAKALITIGDSKKEKVTLQIVDSKGRVVHEFFRQSTIRGEQQIVAPLGHLSKGLYLCVLRTKERTISKKISLL